MNCTACGHFIPRGVRVTDDGRCADCERNGVPAPLPSDDGSPPAPGSRDANADAAPLRRLIPANEGGNK